MASLSQEISWVPRATGEGCEPKLVVVSIKRIKIDPAGSVRGHQTRPQSTLNVSLRPPEIRLW